MSVLIAAPRSHAVQKRRGSKPPGRRSRDVVEVDPQVPAEQHRQHLRRHRVVGVHRADEGRDAQLALLRGRVAAQHVRGVVRRREALREAGRVAREGEAVAGEVVVEGPPERVLRQRAERRVARLQLGVGRVAVRQERRDRVLVDAGGVEVRERGGVLAHDAGGRLRDLARGRLGEDLQVRLVDRERVGELLHERELVAVDLAAGERQHRQHPHRLLRVVVAEHRGRELLRVTRGDGVGVAGIAPEHDLGGGRDRLAIGLADAGGAVRERDRPHRAEDRIGLGTGNAQDHGARA